MHKKQNDQYFLEQAIELAFENKKKGGRPFGAVIVKDHQIVSRGVNNMLASFDPSSHAELEAIRQLTATSRTLDLTGCNIYASAQPCPMCLAAIAMANISEIIFAFDNQDATPFNYTSQSIYDKLKIHSVDFIKMTKLPTQYRAFDLYGEVCNL